MTYNINSALNSQGVIFRGIHYHPDPRCPDHVISQCVDLSVNVSAEVDPVDLSVYYIYTMVMSFFLPLACIIVCYILIALAISRMARVSKGLYRVYIVFVSSACILQSDTRACVNVRALKIDTDLIYQYEPRGKYGHSYFPFSVS